MQNMDNNTLCFNKPRHVFQLTPGVGLVETNNVIFKINISQKTAWDILINLFIIFKALP